jgi:hypothetical protein
MRDLMKLDPYRYVQQVRSSRRLDLENECQRNLEVIWVPNRLPLERVFSASMRDDR